MSLSPASNCSAVIGTLGILETSLTTIFSRLRSQSCAGVRTRVGHGRLTLGPRPSDRSLIIRCQARPRHSLQRRETGGGRNLDHGSVWAAACVWVIAGCIWPLCGNFMILAQILWLSLTTGTGWPGWSIWVITDNCPYHYQLLGDSDKEIPFVYKYLKQSDATSTNHY